MKLDLSKLKGAAGVESARGYSGAPDADGILERHELSAPPFDYGCYYAAFQKYDMSPGQKAVNWPNGANRIQPLRIADFKDLTYGGMFLLLRLKRGGFLALLPLAGKTTMTWLSSRDDRLILNFGTLGTARVEGDCPLFAWARSNDVYDACRAVWQAAMADPLIAASTRAREEKTYPEIFKWLGWCSWEEFKAGITSELLVGAVKTIEKSGLPIRYALVDDGHLDHAERRLRSFAPNNKFPNGWKELMATRQPDKVRWFGVWLNFNGYWNGVAPDNALGELNMHLAPIKSGALLPPRDALSSFAFYDAMIGAARRVGFDFVKVDNQAHNLNLYRGTESPVECAASNSQALEAACARHMDGLINCMAHNTVCALNTRIGPVSRCSEDYKVGDATRAKKHLHNSYGNMPWLGQTVWGDHDMFHSNDPASGRMMAISKAVSGGPVYLSDDPAAFAPEHVLPLCYDDGELLRPLAPATPLPESVFADPFSDAAPFRAVAPLAGGAAAVVVYNLTDPEQPVEGAVTAEDYTDAGALIQPYAGRWAAPREGLLAYDWLSGKAARLGKAGYRFRLETFADLLLLLCPIRRGWAVVGRADKYLSPVGAEIVDATAEELIVRMRESGPLTVWSRKGELSCAARKPVALGGGLWRVNLPIGKRDVIVRLCRSGRP